MLFLKLHFQHRVVNINEYKQMADDVYFEAFSRIFCKCSRFCKGRMTRLNSRSWNIIKIKYSFIYHSFSIARPGFNLYSSLKICSSVGDVQQYYVDANSCPRFNSLQSLTVGLMK